MEVMFGVCGSWGVAAGAGGWLAELVFGGGAGCR